ncbi:domain-containing 1-like [Octopus vulgaris]|uniref:Domain-containing 1-like n=2 Tax=Octopus TaxID=6643 RepID=A0AA36BAV6_OCTVU|nr:domain-containing 1-like [Octopus vulgaris]
MLPFCYAHLNFLMLLVCIFMDLCSCGKPLRNEDEMSMHAARTKHTNFAACEHKVKPLDEATKKEQLQRVQDLLAQKRLENEERDRKEQILKEKKRRSEGKEISKLREYKEDFDRKKLMEDLKRDRLQKKLARDQVLDNIRKDREAMQENDKRRQGGSLSANSTATVKLESPTEHTQNVADRDYSECKLLIRLPTGESLKKEFKAKESLAAVRVYVMTKWSKDDNSVPKLSTAFPRKVYTNDDMAMSLLQLGLVPSAVINVS